MANHMNTAINNAQFNTLNVFEKITPGSPQVGTIYDIDIVGPDNGSVILVDQTPSSFTFQTITRGITSTGSHPENGARQFGFERNDDGSVNFYTRGVSQAEIEASDFVGSYFQGLGWTAMMKCISDEMNRRAQQQVSDPSSISSNKCEKDQAVRY